jgi:hypothetical protein
VRPLKNLQPYEHAFDGCYPEYERSYEPIQQLVELHSTAAALNLLNQSSELAALVELLQPLIAIKNYKSQVPFPRDVGSALRCLIELKQHAVPSPALSGGPQRIFLAMIEIEGFQLPTVSAVFHFCHPAAFPIVDRNVESACRMLKEEHEDVFSDMQLPRLPSASTSGKNKLRKYQSFIAFIDRIMQVQRSEHGGTPDYRFIDRALMVLGVDEFRRRAEGF